MSSVLTRVNGTIVSAELLGEVLEMHANMPAKDRGVMEVRFVRLLDLLDRKGLKDRSSMAMAIDFRLTALAGLQRDQALRGWTMPGNKPGMEFIHADLLKAAAEEPLIEDAEQQVTFDVESFQKRVLANAAARGRG